MSKLADLNNPQLINTLQQRIQNLCIEISILKERLLEETTKLERISQKRDPHKTALQVLTEELRTDGPVALSSNVDQAEINFAEATKRPRLNSLLTVTARDINLLLWLLVTLWSNKFMVGNLTKKLATRS